MLNTILPNILKFNISVLVYNEYLVIITNF